MSDTPAISFGPIDGEYTAKGESQREFYATVLRDKVKELVELAGSQGIAMFAALRFDDECRAAGVAPGEDAPTEDPWVLAHIIASGKSIAVPVGVPSEQMEGMMGMAEAAAWAAELIQSEPEITMIPPSVLAKIAACPPVEREEYLAEARTKIPLYQIIHDYQDKPVDDTLIDALRQLGRAEEDMPQIGVSLSEQKCNCDDCKIRRMATGEDE